MVSGDALAGGDLDLTTLFHPRGVAVVGASERPGAGRQVLENLLQVGYTGEIHPVNPRYDTVLGRSCWPSLEEAAESGATIDLVAVALGRDQVLPVMEQAAAIGARGAWVFASGFAEAGPEGKRLQADLATLCLREDIALCGPNCVGFLRPGRMAAYSAPFSADLPAGNVGVVAQSGSVCLALANSGRGLGYGLLVSSGNEAVLDSTDYMGHMLEDESIDVVLAFIEQFRRPARLLEVARRAGELGKQLVVLKVGRSEVARRAALTHTGALAGSDAVHDAVFQKYGIARVDDLEELVETGVALSALRGRRPRGPRAGVITLSGGQIGLVGDLAAGTDLEFPPWSETTADALRGHLPPYAEVGNPLDAWGSGRIEETYPGCMQAAAQEQTVDLLLVSLDIPPGIPQAQVDQFQIVARAAVEVGQASRRPVFVLSNLAGGLEPALRGTLERGGIPVLQGTRAGLRAVHHAVGHGRQPAATAHGAKRGGEVLGASDGVLDEHTAKKLLQAYDIPSPRERLCRDLEEVLAAAEELGYPVVLKAVAAELAHKTEAGAVSLDLRDALALRSAYDEMQERIAGQAPKLALRGMLVQEMVRGAVAETVVGVTRDPDFGPVVVFGSGGTWVELLGDRSVALPPLAPAEAEEMVRRTVAGRLLAGFRGRPRGDVAALVNALCSVGELAAHWGERIEGLDINPLLVLPEGQGVRAVDALVELRERKGHRAEGGKT